MDEFVLCPLSLSVLGAKATKAINHGSHGRGTDPDITVNDPDNVALSFSITMAHVPDLGIGTELVLRTAAEALRIVIFDEDASIMFREVRYQTL